MKRFKHMFSGAVYGVVADRVDGLCDAPAGSREIYILVPLRTKRGLETAVHEFLHAAKWSLSERDVTRMAAEMAGALWKLGYRHKETK